jgi:hypothetical protein
VTLLESRWRLLSALLLIVVMEHNLGMDIFEHVTIASSLLYSFAIMRLIAALPHAFRSGAAYWVFSRGRWLEVRAVLR